MLLTSFDGLRLFQNKFNLTFYRLLWEGANRTYILFDFFFNSFFYCILSQKCKQFLNCCRNNLLWMFAPPHERLAECGIVHKHAKPIQNELKAANQTNSRRIFWWYWWISAILLRRRFFEHSKNSQQSKILLDWSVNDEWLCQ